MKSYIKAYSTYFLISLYKVGWIWYGLFDFSIFLIHISRKSSFSSISESKSSVVLKREVIDPIKNEKNVRPRNSSPIENKYSELVAPV